MNRPAASSSTATDDGVSPARAIALRALSDLREGRQSARQAIDVLIGQHVASAQDRSLATELVMGVVRHRLTLARVLGRLTARGWPRVGHRLQQILLMGAYQLLWLDGIPEFAAVNEAVQLAKREGGARVGHFVNAVLRSLIREIEHRRIPVVQADPRRAVLIDAEDACQLRSPFLPDPTENPVAYWADATSHPAWLVARWRDAYGLDTAVRICRAGICRPPVIVRPNALRLDAAALQRRLSEEGISSELLPGGAALVLSAGSSFLHTRAFAEGLFQPQDRTAMRVLPDACRSALRPGQVIVDLCAGAGTKATQLAEMMQDRGVILATDKDAARLELLRANALRLGCQSIQIVAMSDLVASVAAAGGAHCVLVDAPCSNSGVLARRPEARYRVSLRAIEKLSQLQSEVLAEAAALLRPGGRLIYSTCSIELEENEQVAVQFAHSHPDWRLIDTRLTLPQAGSAPVEWQDGGYWAAWDKP